MSGYQFQFNPAQKGQLQNRFDIIQKITGWEPPQFFSYDKTIPGTRNRAIIKDKNDFAIENILENDKIFSYVFPHKGEINYTIGINLNF